MEVNEEWRTLRRLQELFPPGWLVAVDRGSLSIELHGLTEREVRDIAARVSLSRMPNGNFVRVTK